MHTAHHAHTPCKMHTCAHTGGFSEEDIKGAIESAAYQPKMEEGDMVFMTTGDLHWYCNECVVPLISLMTCVQTPCIGLQEVTKKEDGY